MFPDSKNRYLCRSVTSGKISIRQNKLTKTKQDHLRHPRIFSDATPHRSPLRKHPFCDMLQSPRVQVPPRWWRIEGWGYI